MSNQQDYEEDYQYFTEKVEETLESIYNQAIERTYCTSLYENHDEYCIICYTNELTAAPTVTLNCGHTFHIECVRELLSHKWSTLRISFSFMKCPTCKQDIQASSLQAELGHFREFKASVE